MATSILSVRVNDTERSLLEIAAKQAHTNLSDFVRKRAVESAEMEVLTKTSVEIPSEAWEQFESWLISEPKVIPQVQELMKQKPIWE